MRGSRESGNQFTLAFAENAALTLKFDRGFSGMAESDGHALGIKEAIK
jgi:hypothetical protein